MAGLGLISRRRAIASSPTAGSDYIKFADEAVFNVLMSNGVSSDGVGITKDDAAQVTSIGTWFQGNTEITSFEEFSYFIGVTSLNGVYNKGAFYGCTNLREITLPDSCITLNAYAFQGCSSLVVVGNLDVVQRAAEGMFYGCPLTEMEEISLPLLATGLASRAFSSMSSPHKISNLGSCTGITGTSYSNFVFGSGATLVRLPSTINTISNYAFRNLTNCQAFICEAATPPAVTNSFTGTSCPIYVPDAAVEAYKTADGWTSYASRIQPLSSYTE